MEFWEEKDSCLVVKVLVQPNASRDRIVGVHGDRLKITLRALPVEGEANHALVDFFSEHFQIPRRAIQIVSGHGHRKKSISFTGLKGAVFLQKINQDLTPQK